MSNMDYAPTTDEVRLAWWMHVDNPADNEGESDLAFDRWLAVAESQHFAIADANKTLIIAGGDTIEEVTDDMVDRAARKIADMDGRTWENLPEGIARDQYTLIAHGALSAGLGIHDHDPGGCTCGCPLLECGRCGESPL